MPDPDGRARPTARMRIRRAAVLVLLGAGIIGLTANEATSRRDPGNRTNASSADTTILYAPTRFYADIGIGAEYEIAFTADTILGKRFLIELVNGSPAVTGFTANVDSQQWLGSSEFGSSVTSLSRIFEIGTTGSHTVVLVVKGSTTSAWATMRIVRVTEPTFLITGPQYFVKPNPAALQYGYFSKANVGETDYTLRAINGTPSGGNRMTNTTIKLNGSSVMSPSDFGTGIATVTRGITPNATNTIEVNNQGATGSRAKLHVRATDQTAPVVSVTQPPTTDTVFTKNPGYRFTGSVTDETPGWLTIADTTWQVSRPPIATPGTFSDSMPTIGQGRHRIRLQVTNSAKLTTTLERWVVRDTVPPTLTINVPRLISPPDSTSSTTDSVLVIAGRWRDTTVTTVTVDGDVMASGFGDSISYSYLLDIGMNRLRFRAVDRLGNETAFTRYYMRLTGTERGGPVASVDSLSPTVTTPFYESVKFLFTGGGAIQLGVGSGALPTDSVGVIRGHVIGRDYGPIANATVSILGYPHFGTTSTRNDGMFDLAVKGGRQYTVRITKPRYLESQRKVMVPLNDFATVDDIAIIGVTARFTVVNLDTPVVARSRFAWDANGDRDMRMIFRPGTQAKVIRPSNGQTVTFSKIRVRATEYTVGTDGQESMPGELPPSSAYTYCVDLRTDEADSMAGVWQVPNLATVFTDTVACYVKNFLHFPVGSNVPLGFYDADYGRWVSENDGVVLAIVDTVGTGFKIDSDLIPGADPQGRLDSLGIKANELAQLRTQFVVGDTLWRMRITHFSKPDANVVLAGLLSALTNGASRTSKYDIQVLSPCMRRQSIVECETRVLRERIPLAGTPYSLNYRSARAAGDKAVRTLRIKLFKDPPPPDLARVIVRLDIAGQRIEVSDNTPNINDVLDITWNGRDAYGRRVTGSAVGRLGVGYQYVMFLKSRGGGSPGSSWADPAVIEGGIERGLGERYDGMAVWSYQRVILGAADASSDGLGGWTLSPHHFYDSKGDGVLYLGDGSVISGESMPPTLTFIAGQGVLCGPPNWPSCDIDDSLAVKSPLRIGGLARGPEGNLYIADNRHGSIYRLGSDGILRRIAGTGTPAEFDTAFHSGPALNCNLMNFTDLAVGPDGAVYFSTADPDGSHPFNNIVGRVRDQILEQIIGGHSGYDGSGDGGHVSQAKIRDPKAIAVGPDGSLFIGDTYASPERARVRRVAPDGRITAYAGKPGSALSDAISIRGIQMILTRLRDIYVDAEGTMYLSEEDRTRVWRITRDGEGRRLLNTGAISGQQRLAGAPDGGLYISDPNAGRVHVLDADGALSSIAGGGASGMTNGLPVAAASLYAPERIVAGDGGSYYFVNGSFGESVWKVSRGLGFKAGSEHAVPDPDGSSVHYFAANGQHLRTRDALTGAVLYQFEYNGSGQLLKVFDVNNDPTVIARNGSGVPQSIAGPFGQTTTVGLTGEFLSSVSFSGESYSLTHSTDGLLQTLQDPETGRVHEYRYDNIGRLMEDEDPEDTKLSLPSPPPPSGITRTNDVITDVGRKTTYEVTNAYDGTVRRKVTRPDMHYTLSVDSAGQIYQWTPDRLTREVTVRPDPRLGMLAAFAGSAIDTIAGVPKRTVEVSRSYDPADFNPPTVNGKWVEEIRVNGQPPLKREYTETGGAVDTLRLTSPAGRIVRLVIDALGRTKAFDVPGMAPLELTRDSHGRITQLKQANRVRSYGYESNGKLGFFRDTLGRMTELKYDGSDRDTLHKLPGGRSIGFRYDRVGNITSVRPPGRWLHEFAYTKTNLNRRYMPPAVVGQDSVASVHEFNGDRQLTRIRRPDGTLVNLRYGTTNGLLDSLSIARGQTKVTYRSDTGQLDILTSPDSVVTAYDYYGPLLRSEQWSGRMPGSTVLSVSRQYDRHFRVSAEAVTGTSDVTYLYDADGLLTNAGPLRVHHRGDNGAIDADTVQVGSSSVIRNVGYDPNYGDVSSLSYGHSTQGALFQQSVTRDELGRIKSVTETAFGTSREWRYRYDDAGRLYGVLVGLGGATPDTVTTYWYDSNGNRTMTSHFASGIVIGVDIAQYDDQDRLTLFGTTQYEYTATGELLRKIATGGDTTTYAYDALGNLTSVRFDIGNVVSYTIDGANRRVGRKWNDVWTGGWIYENTLRPAAELDASGSVLNRYVYGADGLSPSLLIRGGTTYRVISDYLGSVRGVVDVVTGAVAQRQDYDPWGVPLPGGVGTAFQSLGYVCGLVDTTTTLVRLGARDYDGASGRWTARDPIGFDGGDANLFAYVANVPVIYSDPTGLDYITYNGSEVTFYNDKGRRLISFPASSGSAGSGPRDQRIENYGPIPEGNYSVDPGKVDQFLWFDPRDLDWWGSTNRRGWGNYRVPIEGGRGPRRGFFFHGGKRPGSGGCIDLTSHEADFVHVLKQYDDPLPVYVRY